MAEGQRPTDIEALRAAQQAAAGDIDDSVFDDTSPSNNNEQRTAHHIRANSSIMHLKKLLGMLRCGATDLDDPIAPNPLVYYPSDARAYSMTNDLFIL